MRPCCSYSARARAQHGHRQHQQQQQQQQRQPSKPAVSKPQFPASTTNNKERAPAPCAASAAGQAPSPSPRPRSAFTRTSPSGQPRQWLSEDLRELPLPAPYDKHELRGGPAPRFDRPWSWPSWRTWTKACWDRKKWFKKDVNRVLDLRAHDPSNAGVDWSHCSDRWDSTGWIYAVYHFATGRWYVGQTIRTIHQRAYDHWTARFREADLFHQALALDKDPFGFIAFPLEFIPRER